MLLIELFRGTQICWHYPVIIYIDLILICADLHGIVVLEIFVDTGVQQNLSESIFMDDILLIPVDPFV